MCAIKRSFGMLLFAVLPAMQCAWADIYVGTGDTRRHEVASDTEQAENVVIAPRGTLLKTGEGTLTLPTSRLVQGWGANMAVDQGELVIRQEGAPAQTGFENPPAVIQNAAVWFDTREASSFVRDGSDNITDWLDRRETGNAADGYQYVRAHTDNTVTNLCPELRAKDGTTGLYFQGYKSGCFMNLLKPDGSQSTVRSYNVFAVQGQFDNFAPLFGIRKSYASNNLAFVPGNSSGAFMPFWIYFCYEIPAMHAARTYIDGDEVDAFTTLSQFPNDRFSLLEVEFLVTPGDFQCFFNDRDFWASRNVAGMNYNSYAGDRIGGEYICEVVAFTNALTAAERLQVEGYLMAKWFGVKRPASLSVATAPGTQVTVEVPAGGVAPVPLSLDGAGDAVFNGSGDSPLDFVSLLDGFTGTLRLGSGNMVFRQSQPISVSAGEQLAVEEPYDGRRLSRSATAADAFIKSGAGTVRVNALPGGVKNIQVTGGELILEAPRAPSSSAVEAPSSVVTGFVPNASFEIGMGATTTTINLGTTTGYEGWTAVAGEGSSPSQLAWINHSTYKGGKNDSSPYWNLPTEVPDGECVLAINKGASVWTTITLPQEGVYELSFMGAARLGKGGLILELAVGADSSSLETFGYFRAFDYRLHYLPYRYTLPRLAAGSYQLWFKQVDVTQDKCGLIDDVKLTRIPDEKAGGIVPNGSFEDFKGTYADLPYPDKFMSGNFNALKDWTLVQSAKTNGLPSSALLYTGSSPVTLCMTRSDKNFADGAATSFYNHREGDDGFVQLYLMDGAAASVTFTPPAGRYFVQSDIGLWRTTGESSLNMAAYATVTPAGGGATSLGKIGIYNEYMLKRRLFPTAFSVDGATAITLTLTATNQTTAKTGHLLFDNVRLVPASSTYSENLIANGSFSSQTDWNYVNLNGSLTPEASWKPRRLEAVNSVTAYGANWLDGWCLLVVDHGLVTQNVQFHEAGRYRLRVAARKRVSWNSPTAKATDPILFWVARGGETNEIARFAPAVTNFTEYSWAFNVPAAGNDWTFGIEGLGESGKDANTLIDAISIVRDPVSSETPAMDEGTSVHVSSGAKLRLDFPGTNKIERLVLDGRAYQGVVTAKDAPAYLSGDGAFFILPKGTLVIIK